MEPSTNKTEEELFPDAIPLRSMEETIAKTSDITQPLKSPNYKKDTTGWKLNTNGQVEFNNIYTALAGTKIYYVANSSGGAVTRKLTFKNGLLTSET